ncbi:hypothetical protein EV130_11611 [Rhizobium azibense]|uniref:Uncharacterized protein n=2 Tax=Rhizobium azibense TaxID=1136135 RepID=A0A4R3Q861_9HYPH|nr:hypothetical protein EV130_11611 [Rhizobium azibense]
MSRWVMENPERYSIASRERKAASAVRSAFWRALPSFETRLVSVEIAFRSRYFNMRKIALLLLAVAGLPAVCNGAEITAPVQEIMDATVKNWSGNDTGWIDIFAPPTLDKLYSKDFVAKYLEALKHPAMEEGISPFDHDVIVNAQDACPLQDLTLTPQGAAEGRQEIVVRFRKMACGIGPEAQTISTVRFEMVTDGGKPLIDDIMMESAGPKELRSLKAEMVTIAKGG